MSALEFSWKLVLKVGRTGLLELDQRENPSGSKWQRRDSPMEGEVRTLAMGSTLKFLCLLQSVGTATHSADIQVNTHTHKQHLSPLEPFLIYTS